MNRLTLADAQSSRIAPAIGMVPTLPKFIAQVNEAQERLLHKGLWWGTYGKFRLAAYNNTVTLPPCLATIETVAVNHWPVQLHDMWFEFIEHGFGTRALDSVGSAGGSALSGGNGMRGMAEANLMGNFPVFRDFTVNANSKKVVMVCDLARSTAMVA